MSISTNHSNTNYTNVDEKLSLLSGLSLGQINAAKKCKKEKCCNGCYDRLIELTNNVQGAAENQQTHHKILRTSRAITYIKESHRFNLGLISRYQPDFTERDIQPIQTCENIDCKCKRVWVNLKNTAEEIRVVEQNVQNEEKELQQLKNQKPENSRISSNQPYYAPKKDSAHLLYITETNVEALTEKKESLVQKCQELVRTIRDTKSLHSK